MGRGRGMRWVYRWGGVRTFCGKTGQDELHALHFEIGIHLKRF